MAAEERQYRIGVGTVLNELYAVDSLIAVGGMGEVYRGHVIETGEQVAIKTIRPEHAQNADALTLFKKEAKALRKLYHDAIVRYFVFTVDRASASPYLAMEYVEGEPLSDIVRKGKLEFEPLCVLVKRVASGLQAAHLHGITHRDISPDNIIVPDRDYSAAKIIDFGIARSTMGEATVVGSGFAGKFAYVSPEQLGLFGGDVTGKSDIYSFGLVLAQAGLGRAIDMGGSHVDVVEKRRRVPDLSGLDPRLRPLVQAMLQPNPKDRPADMSVVADWPLLKGRGTWTATRIGVAAASVLLLAGLGGGGFLLWPSGSPAPPGAGSGRIDAAAPPEPAPPRVASITPPPAVLSEPPPPAAPPQPLPPPSSGTAADRSAAAPPEIRLEPPPPVAPLPPVEPARLPPVASLPAPGTPAVPASVEQIAAFVRDYRGGACFHAAPVSISRSEAVVEAFGSSPAPFVVLDADLQRLTGFEPDMIVRQVTAAQCPVVDAMARQAGSRAVRSPRLAIRSERLKAGGQLSGSVEARPDSVVEVFLVDDGGQATNLSRSLKRAGDQVAFSSTVDPPASGGDDRPQLVVAVATGRPLPSLRAVTTARIDQVLRQVSEDAAKTGQQAAVSVRYFKLSP